jgi:hypothetical protein
MAMEPLFVLAGMADMSSARIGFVSLFRRRIIRSVLFNGNVPARVVNGIFLVYFLRKVWDGENGWSREDHDVGNNDPNRYNIGLPEKGDRRLGRVLVGCRRKVGVCRVPVGQ